MNVTAHQPVAAPRAFVVAWLIRRRWLHWMAVLVLVVAVAVQVMATIWTQPTAATVTDLTDSGSRIAQVATGSFEWLAGVRQGDRYTRWEQGPGGDVATLSMVFGMADSRLPRPPGDMVVVLGVLFLGFVLGRPAPRLSALALFLAAVLATTNLLGVAAMPIALLVVATPSVVGLLVARSLDRRVGRWIVVSLLGTTAVVVAVIVSARDAEAWTTGWRISWIAPTLVVAAAWMWVTVAALRSGARASWRERGLAEALVADSLVGRRIARLAEEDSRDRSAFEVHDHVLPGLTAGLRALDAGDEDAGRRMLNGLARELRRGLEDDQLLTLRVGGLLGAVEGPIRRLEEAGIQCSQRVAASSGRPPWEVEVAALRIVQEALNNVVCHSSADYVDVDIATQPRRVRVEIVDDGVGLDGSRFDGHSDREHLGIAGMVARAREVGGQVDIGHVEPAGTRVTFRWPA